MEMVRKYGLWALAGAIALAALVIYIFFVHNVTDQVSSKRAEIETRRDNLKGWAQKGSQIPSPTKIQVARKNAEQVASMLDQCELYLAQQPRWAHTIRFFTGGPFGPETEVPLDHPNDWLNFYLQYNEDLQNQVNAAGISYAIQRTDSMWGSSVPMPEQMRAAMELYWFQKDLIDFLTQQVEKDFAAYLEFKAKDRADPFPARPFDLVVNRSPARLDEFLRSTSREKLVAVLGAIVVNRNQQDLATIFNTLLRDEKKPDGTIVYGFPWSRPASEKEHGSVRGFTMDEAQEKFLAEMLPPDKPDLANRQRFRDYVMDLRMVRYRADIVGLLESHHFDSLAAALRKGTEAELDGILNEIADVNGEWNTTRIAEAISAIVSINNENDFVLVRNNHTPNIAALISLSVGGGDETSTLMPSAGAGGGGFFMGRPGGPGGAALMGRLGAAGQQLGAPGNSVYKRRTFQMQVKLKFERIPVFLHGLISNSWHYHVEILDVIPTETTLNRVSAPVLTGMPGGGAMPSGRGMPQFRGPMGMPFGAGMQFARGMMGRGFTPPTPLSAGAAAPRPTRQGGQQMFETGDYVIVSLVGEGYQFSPLLTKYKSKLENRAEPPTRAPTGKSAAPTGAR
jgi:hypothetical protein